MPAKKELVEQLIQALKDDSVVAAIGGVVELKLTELLDAVNDLRTANEEKTLQLAAVKADLKAANDKIESLESHSRSTNVIICGLPPSSFAAAAVGGGNDNTPSVSAENSATTETEVLRLFNDKMGLQIKSGDISVTHRLGKNNRSTAPAPIIVRFTSKKVKDLVYNARRLLKSVMPGVFINEDLTRKVAALFQRARQCVKDRKLHSTWSFGGCVYIKETGTSRPARISTETELPR